MHGEYITYGEYIITYGIYLVYDTPGKARHDVGAARVCNPTLRAWRG